jgi:large subunit ribosomal protein L24
VIVEGVNIARKHSKPRSAEQPGGIIDKAMPIHVSNVAVLSPSDGKPTRVGYQVRADGSKIRVCKRTGTEIPEVLS